MVKTDSLSRNHLKTHGTEAESPEILLPNEEHLLSQCTHIFDHGTEGEKDKLFQKKIEVSRTIKTLIRSLKLQIREVNQEARRSAVRSRR